MIINLTQHAATPDQIAAGVVDLDADLRAELARQLTFDALPDWVEVQRRALAIAAMAEAVAIDSGIGGARAMIGGAPYLMARLEDALRNLGITPVYAFSVRASVEQTQPDGSVRKVNVFRHGGFVAP